MTSPPRSRIAVPLPGPDADLFAAICAICDGQSTRADFDRLERMLQDPAAMKVYLAVTELDASLRWRVRGRSSWQVPTGASGRLKGRDRPRQPHATPEVRKLRPSAQTPAAVTRPVPAGPARQLRPVPLGSLLRRTAIFGVVVLATVAIGGAIAYFSVGKPPMPNAPPLPRLPGSVACVTSLHNVTWSKNDGTPARKAFLEPDLSTSLFPGQRLALDRGLIEITFDSGARVILDGPIAFEVSSASLVRLDRGRLTATVAKRPGAVTGPRFSVETPTATVTDIGTSFGVAVNEAGLTDVRVFEGLVDLLPRLEAGAGDARSPAALRLAKGQTAAITAPGKVSTHSPRGTIAFKRSMPKGASSAPAGETPLAWDDARATAIYRDTFEGSGQLAGSSPSRRDGTGRAAWIAPATNWGLANGELVAASRGKASLPFVPEPGRIYRLEATLNVTAGRNAWAAIGFSGAPTPDDPTMSTAWILQRHSIDLDANLMFFGSDAQNLRVVGGDSLTGRRTLAILLDTRRPQWAVTFFADGRPLGGGVLPASTRSESICLACQDQACVSFDDFSLLVMESFDESRN